MSQFYKSKIHPRLNIKSETVKELLSLESRGLVSDNHTVALECKTQPQIKNHKHTKKSEHTRRNNKT